jgi:hypothetical protein
MTDDSLIDLYMSAYALSIHPNGSFNCSYKGAYVNAGCCSHLYAAKHLEKQLNVGSMLQQIDKPKRQCSSTGRPKGYIQVGFAAHLPSNVSSERGATQYLGTTVAKRFPEIPDKIFTDRVDDFRFAGKSSTSGKFVFHVTYPPYDTDMKEELALAELRTGFRLYEDYMVKMSKL